MKITKNTTFGQLYATYGSEDVRIPKGNVEAFLETLNLEDDQKTALNAGQEIDVQKPFNLAEHYEG